MILALAALSLAAALLVRPIACAVSADYALVVSCPVAPALLQEGALDVDPGDWQVLSDALPDELRDPWGRPWRYEWVLSDPLPGDCRLYSVGPDGRDDRGSGDDVVMWPSPDLVAFDEHVRVGGVVVAALLVWLWAVVRAACAPRAAGPVEAARALVIASLPAGAVALLAFRHARDLAPLEGVVDAQRLFVPLPVAVSATAAMLLWLGALRLRLRKAPTGDEATVLAWRGPLLIILVAAGVLLPARMWSYDVQNDINRQRLLAYVCMIGPHPFRIETDDLDLLRSFARHARFDMDVTGLSDAFYDGLARVGVDAVPLLARALQDRGAPSSSSYASTPWRHLRANDPTLDALFAAIAARPQAYRGLVMAKTPLVASRAGRGVVAAALSPFLDDTRLTGNSTSATTDGGTTVYQERFCDDVVEHLSWLFPEPRPFEAPTWHDQTTERWDAVVAKARTWALEGASFGAPVAWVVLDVRGLTLVSDRANVEVTLTGSDGTWSASSGASEADQLVVLSPATLKDARALRIIDEADARAVDVAIAPRAGETTWITVDMAAGTSATRVYTPPP